MNINKKVLILANGKFPEKKSSIEILTASVFLICCDGAASKAIELDITPDIIIGDMDSLYSIEQNRLSHRIIKINDQNSSDLSKALSWLNNKDIESATILGVDGFRDDHSLSNILLVLENIYPYKINIITDYGEFNVINTSLIEPEDGCYTQKFSSFDGQGVSVFCVDRSAKLQSLGLKYSLNDFTFDKLYGASLNISRADHFSISCNKDNTNINII